MDYDVFNGDADGICALHQLRLHEPREAELISGVKRDVKLLAKIKKIAVGDRVTVLDISMDSNKEDLLRLLESAEVFYADHHFAGDIPSSPFLSAHLDPSADCCTSLIVDRLLDGKFRAWAVAAAFGDNLHEAARQAGATLRLSEESLASLRELGELFNYNGYGKTVADLHFSPQELYRAVQPFADPFAFIEKSPALPALREGFHNDMERAKRSKAEEIEGVGRIFHFPGESWARRVAGVFSNEKARERPNVAHALLVDNLDGTFLVSVRAPLKRKEGADALCRAFPTGGGRAAAAGINSLPMSMLDEFSAAFRRTFSFSPVRD